MQISNQDFRINDDSKFIFIFIVVANCIINVSTLLVIGRIFYLKYSHWFPNSILGNNR